MKCPQVHHGFLEEAIWNGLALWKKRLHSATVALKLFLSTCGESHGVVHSQTMKEKEAEMIYWCNRHPSPACSFRHDLKNLITSVNTFIQMLWESKKEFLKVQRYKGHISCSKAVDFSWVQNLWPTFSSTGGIFGEPANTVMSIPEGCLSVNITQGSPHQQRTRNLCPFQDFGVFPQGGIQFFPLLVGPRTINP